MSKSAFRLEVKLRIEQNALEISQARLAKELQLFNDLQEKRDVYIKRVADAINGQREAGINHPEDLPKWLPYIKHEKSNLQKIELLLVSQNKKVEEERKLLVEKHQSVEKFKRLKKKILLEAHKKELKKEQAFIDESGQQLFNRKRIQS